MADLAAGFQAAVVDTLVRNTMRAAEAAETRGLILSGGVAANSALRSRMASEARKRGLPFAVAPKHLCTRQW